MTSPALRILFRSSKRGFSLIEMMMSSVLFLALSTASYQVMKAQRGRQMASLEQQKKTNASSVALDRFKADARMIDSSWSSLGLAAIFPHQGLSFGGNAYLDGSILSEHGVSDGVTFLRRHPEFDQNYQVVSIISGSEVCVIEDAPLEDHTFRLDSADNLAEGDWMLVHQEGRQIVAIVDSVVEISAGVPGVTLAFPASTFLQDTANSTKSGSTHITSFTSKPGVRPTDFDHTGLQTTSAEDDDLCLTTSSGNKITMQKIFSPVSYLMAYATNDGLEKSASNAYLLDSAGQKRTVLTRIEHDAINGQQREYIADVDQLALTYDIQTNDEGGMMVEVGRDSTKKGLLDIGMTQPAENETEFFFTNSDILAINLNAMLILPDATNPGKLIVKNHEVKASFDMIRGENVIAESMHVESSVSGNLNVFHSVNPNLLERVGNPLYVKSGSSAAGEMLIPVSRVVVGDINAIPNFKTLSDDGRITILDPDGNAATEEAESSIVFYSQMDDQNNKSTFQPDTVQIIEKADGSKVLLVGGVSISGDTTETSGTVLTEGYEASMARNTAVAVIDIPAGTSIADHLADNHQDQLLDAQGQTTRDCNIPGCALLYAGKEGSALHPALLDSANIALAANGDILMVPMTKPSMNDGSFVFRVPKSGEYWAEGAVENLSEIPGSSNGRVVSAIASQTIHVGSDEYLPVCVTKPMPLCTDRSDPSTCNYLDSDTGLVINPNEEKGLMGEIRLMNVTNPSAAVNSVFLANHNYSCGSMSVSENKNLLVSGRLTVHAISNEDMYEAVNLALDSSSPSDLQKFEGVNRQLLLDDVAMINEDGDNVYADAYEVDPSSFGNGDSQNIGWRGGTSVAEFGDGTFGVLSTNTVREDRGGGKLTESLNVGIHKVVLPNMKERVMVNIQTDPTNINNTRIIATYFGGGAFEDYPTTYIPGKYIVNVPIGETPGRTEPTALPGLMTDMSTSDWVDLYRELKMPQGQGINSEMPVLDLTRNLTIECDDAYVDTCAY